jgi:hypothetical protein
MHPEILRELTAQRSREMRDRAHQAMLARAASRMRRALRRGGRAPEDEEFTSPAIPDYVDGSFRTVPADDAVARQPGRVPAARRAA